MNEAVPLCEVFRDRWRNVLYFRLVKVLQLMLPSVEVSNFTIFGSGRVHGSLVRDVGLAMKYAFALPVDQLLLAHSKECPLGITTQILVAVPDHRVVLVCHIRRIVSFSRTERSLGFLEAGGAGLARGTAQTCHCLVHWTLTLLLRSILVR